jgi:hypothetical protein
MGQWVDLRWGWRARIEVKPFFVLVPIVKLSTAAVLWVCGACRLWGQSKEVGGITVDEKGRHPSCLPVL